MNMKEAFYDTGAPLQKQGDAPEFERAILQTAVIYRIAQHREERARSGGRSVGEVIQSEEQAAIYKSLLFALIDEWLLDKRESSGLEHPQAHALGAHSAGQRVATRAAVHN
ncbi:MAG: hypothetical protein ACM3SV_12295 [Betaproteobacteria bacterium]